MSPPFTEEPDPLLAFSTETATAPAVTPAPEPAAQPVAAPVDPPRPSPPSVPIESLVARLDRVERALEESKARVTSLKSEVATLVRAVGDIRTASARPVPATMPIVQGRRASFTASAIVGAVLGIAAAVFGWTYLSSDSDVSIAASPPPQQTAQPPAVEPATEPAPALIADVSRPSIVSIAHEAPKAHQAPEAPQAPQAPRYVGTLSIDADPGGDVFLDRQSAGRTPLRLTNLRAGSHLIWIERDGFRRFTRVVQVPADRVTRLFADLEPLASR